VGSCDSAGPARSETCTLSLHDALPIWPGRDRGRFAEVVGDEGHVGVGEPGEGTEQGVGGAVVQQPVPDALVVAPGDEDGDLGLRSEEHTSELQSRENLVCRLLLEKKKK